MSLVIILFLNQICLYLIKNLETLIYSILKISIDDDSKEYLDGSFLSLYNKNHIYTIGRKSYFWNSGGTQSLVLSTQARPIPSIHIQNIAPLNLKFIGDFSYQLMLGQLEKNRTIPYAKILGMRVSFYPIDSFTWSVTRMAQFGGKGRPKDFETIINLLIGKDNSGSSGIDISNEPGNQLASIDFKKNFNKKNIKLFGQIAGEDEAGMLPSRTLYQIGISKNNLFYGDDEIVFEYVNTFSSSGIKNYTYNHSIYIKVVIGIMANLLGHQ